MMCLCIDDDFDEVEVKTKSDSSAKGNSKVQKISISGRIGRKGSTSNSDEQKKVIF